MNIQKRSVKGIVLGFVLLFVLLSVGCEQENANAVVASEEQKILDLTKQLEQKNKELEKLNQKIEKAEQEKVSLTDEIAYDQAFVQKAMELLTEEQKELFIQSEWQYSLQLDGIDISQLLQDQTITLEKSSFQVTLTEKKPAYMALPEELINTGKVGSNLSELITIEEGNASNEKQEKKNLYEMSTIEEGLNNSVTYQLKDIKDKTTVILNLTDELQKRLNLKVNQLTIHIKMASSSTSESTTETKK